MQQLNLGPFFGFVQNEYMIFVVVAHASCLVAFRQLADDNALVSFVHAGCCRVSRVRTPLYDIDRLYGASG